jgi:hypothetical protein
LGTCFALLNPVAVGYCKRYAKQQSPAVELTQNPIKQDFMDSHVLSSPAGPPWVIVKTSCSSVRITVLDDGSFPGARDLRRRSVPRTSPLPLLARFTTIALDAIK